MPQFNLEKNKLEFLIFVPKGNHTISFEFRETGFRYTADVISSLGILIYGIYLIYLLSKGVRKSKRI